MPKSTVYAVNGTSAILVCQIDSYPAAIHYWYFKGEKIFSDSRRKVQQIDKNNTKTDFQLNITNVNPGDYGDYYCFSKNEQNTTFGHIKLHGK